MAAPARADEFRAGPAALHRVIARDVGRGAPGLTAVERDGDVQVPDAVVIGVLRISRCRAPDEGERRAATIAGDDRRELGERDRGAGGDIDRRDPVSSVVVRRRHDWPTATRRRVVGATAAVRRDVGEPVVGLVAVIDAGNPQHAPSLSVVVAHRYSPSAVAVLQWQVGPTCRHGSRARDAPLLISKSSLALRTTCASSGAYRCPETRSA